MQDFEGGPLEERCLLRGKIPDFGKGSREVCLV